MNIEEIKAAAERLVFLANQGRPGVYPGLQFARALLAALPVVEALKAYEHECDNPVPDYMHRRHLREHLFKTIAAFDKTIEGLKP